MWQRASLNQALILFRNTRRRSVEIMDSKQYEAIVIGGGLGGLVSATALSKRGKKVLLLEKGHMVGGYQVHFKRGPFTIEPCFHFTTELGQGGAVKDILAELGVGREIEFSRMEPAANFVFPDGTISMPSDQQVFTDLLKSKFPENSEDIDGIFYKMNKIYQGLKRFPEFEAIVGEYAGKPFQFLLDEFIDNKKLQTIIGGFAAWFGPFSRLSSLLMCGFIGTILNDGSYIPAGGVKSLVGLFETKLKELGGEILLRSPVKKMIIQEGKAAGIVLQNGERFDSNTVISNVDATYTFFDMVGEEYLPREFASNIRNLELSHSTFNVFLGVKSKDLRLGELPHLIYVLPDYDLEGQFQAMNKGELEKSNFSITIPTKANPSFAPEGHDIIMILTNMPYRLEGVDWKKDKADFTQRMINLADKIIPGLKENIIMTESATPETLYRYTGNAKGACGGWAFTPKPDFLRPENKSPIEGLYLAGHWTFPGVGINSVIKSGWLTASLIV